MTPQTSENLSRHFDSGGFRFEISESSLIVSRASSSSRVSKITFVIYGFIYTVVLICLVLVLVILAREFVILGVAILIGLAFRLLDRDRNLRCDSFKLEIIELFYGRITRTRSFPISQVQRVRFGIVSTSKYNITHGLVFEVASKSFKLLSGLQEAEAKLILDEMESFGYSLDRAHK